MLGRECDVLFCSVFRAKRQEHADRLWGSLKGIELGAAAALDAWGNYPDNQGLNRFLAVGIPGVADTGEGALPAPLFF